MNNIMIKETNIQNAIRRDDHNDKLQRFDNILEYKRNVMQENIFGRLSRIEEMTYFFNLT